MNIKLLESGKSEDILSLCKLYSDTKRFNKWLFWVLLFLVFNKKKVCQPENTTLRKLCMESTLCGFD